MDKSNLLLLFERPLEPIFTLKGDKKKTSFVTPPDYLNDKHKAYAAQVVSRFGESADEQVNVPQISIPPMDDLLELKRDAGFSLFIDKHRKLAARLIDIFMGFAFSVH
ncbi:hypothetical protein NQ314_001548 [Rhamnusium bicolor]|uniref:Uncharacterized protein n=1 Tax=Rhamnusium bicolor TaxID=1586634 RepID=A0AAV8ZTQ4_9CUCU|nr:hypothetical protein NQ314_001548 [Rhamnusium bicolor]